MTTPKRQARPHPVSVRMTAAVAAELERLARTLGWTKTQVVEQAIMALGGRVKDWAGQPPLLVVPCESGWALFRGEVELSRWRGEGAKRRAEEMRERLR